MEKELIAVDIDVFNKMFCQLADRENHICWIRSLDFKRQLYLSPQFEPIFGRSVSTLYDTPDAWYDFLLKIDNKDMRIIMPNRIENPVSHNGENVVYYRIATPNNEVRYIRDWSILLRDRSNQYVAVAGVAEKISAPAWYEEQENPQPSQFSTCLPNGKTLFEILDEEKKLHILPNPQDTNLQTRQPIQCLNIEGMRIELSKREADCLYHLCLGKSAKETGEMLFISPRTVETHLENIKQKTFCKSKLQLMSYVIRQFMR